MFLAFSLLGMKKKNNEDDVLTTTHRFLLYFVLGCVLILHLVTDLRWRDKEPAKNTKQTSFNLTATYLKYISIYSANTMDNINKAGHSEISILGNFKSVSDSKRTEKTDCIKVNKPLQS